MKDIDDKDLVDVSGGAQTKTPSGLRSGVPVDGPPNDDDDDEDKTLGDNPGGNVIPT